MDNLWMLGGEILRDMHEDHSLRRVGANRLLGDVVHPDAGLLIHNGSEEAQSLFDPTCRKLPPFFSAPAPPGNPRLLGRVQPFLRRSRLFSPPPPTDRAPPPP